MVDDVNLMTLIERWGDGRAGEVMIDDTDDSAKAWLANEALLGEIRRRVGELESCEETCAVMADPEAMSQLAASQAGLTAGAVGYSLAQVREMIDERARPS